MIYTMTMCIGMTLGMCHSIVVRDYGSMEECKAEREHHYKHVPNVAWITCERKPNEQSK